MQSLELPTFSDAHQGTVPNTLASQLAAWSSAHHPASAANIWAYLRRIVRCARTFGGNGWVDYDRLYRRQAAATRSLSRAIEDQNLYNEAFCGRAKPVARCKVCLSEHHGYVACPGAPHLLLGQPEAPSSRHNGHEICRRFNQERCFTASCKFRHACSNCSGNHPATTCGSCRSRATPTHPYPRNGNQS